MGAWGAAAMIGGSVISGFANYQAAKEQRKAQEKAAKAALARGKEAAGRIRESTTENIQRFGEARGTVAEGESRYRGELEAERGMLGERFGAERDVGGRALGRLEEMLLGEQEDFQFKRPEVAQILAQDPSYQFTLSEGQKAIERAARSRGGFGGGANIKDFLRYGQKTASQFAEKAIDRDYSRQVDAYNRARGERSDLLGGLSGLQRIGSQANINEANLRQGYTGNIAQSYSRESGTMANLLQNEAQFGQAGAIAAENLYTGVGNQVLGADLQASQNAGAGWQAFGGVAQNATNTLAYLYGTGALGGGQNNKPDISGRNQSIVSSL